MTLRVLVSAPYLQPVLDRFRARFAEHGIELVVPPVDERLSEAELLAWIGGIDGVIAGDDQVTERVLRAAPRLKVLSKWGTGTDSFDHDACRRHGVVIRNTPDAFSQPVADSVLGYTICLLRQLPAMDRAIRAGEWAKKPQGRALHECTLGIIGVGNVGKAVARRARAFGMRLLGTDPVAMPAAFLAESGITMVARDELLAAADVVTLNCDLNPTSVHLMDDRAFAALEPGAFLINTARGRLVDEAALVRALDSGRLAGAALDVFEDEPLPMTSPLRRFNNVMFAPHNANSSPAAWERVHHATIDNLLAVLLQPPAHAAAAS